MSIFELNENQVGVFQIPCPHCNKRTQRLALPHETQYAPPFQLVRCTECSSLMVLEWAYDRGAVVGISKVDIELVEIPCSYIHTSEHDLSDEEVELVQEKAKEGYKELMASGEGSYDNPYDQELDEERYVLYNDAMNILINNQGDLSSEY